MISNPVSRKAISLTLNALLFATALFAIVAVPTLKTVTKPIALAATPDAKTITTTATLADVASTVVSATAQPGEGMIRITTRVCGSADGWQANASANGIIPPIYLVLLGQTLRISCDGTPAPSTPAPSAPSQPASSGWVNPLPGACITSSYGVRDGGFHYGTDLGGAWGTPIHAAAAGTAYRGWEAGGAGNYITINHGGGVYTLYMHQSSFAVASGQWVSAGQIIGYVGETGDAHGAHLHFEVRPNGNAWGTAVDAVPFMAARGVRLGC
jgi:murein DD-endopeptidase MepM/ murein hydrolase activator NlpD